MKTTVCHSCNSSSFQTLSYILHAKMRCSCVINVQRTPLSFTVCLFVSLQAHMWVSTGGDERCLTSGLVGMPTQRTELISEKQSSLGGFGDGKQRPGRTDTTLMTLTCSHMLLIHSLKMYGLLISAKWLMPLSGWFGFIVLYGNRYGFKNIKTMINKK